MGRRDQYNLFIERHEVAWELTMGFLALIWVAVGFLIDELGSGVRTDLELVEAVLSGVFIAEFVSRLVAAHDRRQYVRGHWIDALALSRRYVPCASCGCSGSCGSFGRSPASIGRPCTFKDSPGIGGSPG